MSEHRRPSIVILASGNGSTAESFIYATQAGIVDAEVGLVISNNKDAGVLKRVERLNGQYGLDIKSLHISGVTHPRGPGEKGEQTLEESEAITLETIKGDFALVALMGYMKKIRGDLLTQFGWLPEYNRSSQAKLINTHPGLLPATEGLFGINVQKFVIEEGHKNTGQTLHFVGGEYDTGPKLAEHLVPVLPSDTPESIFEAVQLVEKTYVPVDIQRLLHGDLSDIEL